MILSFFLIYLNKNIFLCRSPIANWFKFYRWLKNRRWTSLHEIHFGTYFFGSRRLEIFLFKSHKDRLSIYPIQIPVINAHFQHLSPKVFKTIYLCFWLDRKLDGTSGNVA